MYFDSHVHFRHMEGPDGAEALIARAVDAKVERMVAVGGDCELNKQAVAAMRQFPETVRAAIGFDRDEAEQLTSRPGELDDALDRIRFTVEQLDGAGHGIAALGEVGLDFHYNPESSSQQEALFSRQLELARTVGRPVIVHSRDAEERTLALLREHVHRWSGDPDRIGVLHCFTGTVAFAQQLVEIGFYISFSGILSFLNADPLRDVARVLPLGRLLIETDTPYLAPVPHRGKKNEPAFVADVARCLARVRGEPEDVVAEVTTANACRLFDG